MKKMCLLVPVCILYPITIMIRTWGSIDRLLYATLSQCFQCVMIVCSILQFQRANSFNFQWKNRCHDSKDKIDWILFGCYIHIELLAFSVAFSPHAVYISVVLPMASTFDLLVQLLIKFSALHSIHTNIQTPKVNN